MNRHQRRAEAARNRPTRTRHAAVKDTVALLTELDDPSISGVTVLLPDGQALYVPAAAAHAKAKPGGVH